MMQLNPFILGRALDPTEMVGRKDELRTILSRLVKRQSTAVVGYPHTGKTTLLMAMQNEGTRRNIIGSYSDTMIYGYVDAHMMRGIQSQGAFWEQALRTLEIKLMPGQAVEHENKGTDLRQSLHVVLNNLFSKDEVQSLAHQLGIDYDGLAGEGKLGKALNLEKRLADRGRLAELESMIRRLRPNALVLPAMVEDAEPNENELAESFLRSRNSGFDVFHLEQLFDRLAVHGKKYVLLIDEFDDFLNNAVLHKADFYGSLRSLSSRSRGFSLVLAVRQDLETLNRLTQRINPHGSPYFNVFTELHLGPLSERSLASLLNKVAYFNLGDRRFVLYTSGGQPFLAQAAAAALWDAYDGGLTGARKYAKAAENFQRQTSKHFADTWRFLASETKKALLMTGLRQTILNQKLSSSRYLFDLGNYTPDLEKLAYSGVVKEDTSSGWQIQQGGLLWWMANELTQHARSENDFERWLHQNALDGVISREERTIAAKAAVALTQYLELDAGNLVQAMVAQWIR